MDFLSRAYCRFLDLGQGCYLLRIVDFRHKPLPSVGTHPVRRRRFGRPASDSLSPSVHCRCSRNGILVSSHCLIDIVLVLFKGIVIYLLQFGRLCHRLHELIGFVPLDPCPPVPLLVCVYITCGIVPTVQFVAGKGCRAVRKTLKELVPSDEALAGIYEKVDNN